MQGLLSRPFVGHKKVAFGDLAPTIFFGVGAAIGFWGWGQSSLIWPLVLLCALPISWALSKTRLQAFMLMLGYYLLASRGLPQGAVVFFGDRLNDLTGYAFWLVTSGLLAFPWIIFWHKRAIGFVVGLLLTTLPPIGLIGWTSPLTAAGILFPRLGWNGLLLTIILFGILATIYSAREYQNRKIKLFFPFIVIALYANVIAYSNPPVPINWYSVDTKFPKLGSRSKDNMEQIIGGVNRASIIREFAASIPDNVIYVMPETILGEYTSHTQQYFSRVDEELSSRGSKLLIGAEYPVGKKYKNGILVLGATNGESVNGFQDIPVPVSMWNPLMEDGAVANIWGHNGVLNIQNKTVGVLICYEESLPWSLLWMMTQQPQILVGMANVWWARGTSIPSIQKQTIHSFARLFNLPLIAAQNL